MIAAQQNAQRVKRLGKGAIQDYSGLTWYGTRKDMALLFGTEDISHNLIAHEIFHATHVILDFVGNKFSIEHTEPFAYLSGYITDLVYKDIKKWKIKIKS
jgi:hypothetical protein